MENASKALIIAGAILLAILIISLGIIVYRQAAGVIDSNSMDEVAVTTFNSKFTQYEGENVRGANVNALISSVVQNNLSNRGDASKQVSIKVEASEWSDGKPADAITPTSTNDVKKALTGKSYIVECTPDPDSGYVTTITIKDATTTTT